MKAKGVGDQNKNTVVGQNNSTNEPFLITPLKLNKAERQTVRGFFKMLENM